MSFMTKKSVEVPGSIRKPLPSFGLGRGEQVLTWQARVTLTNTERLLLPGGGPLDVPWPFEGWEESCEARASRVLSSGKEKGEAQGSISDLSTIRFLVMRGPSQTIAMTSQIAEEGTSTQALFRPFQGCGRCITTRTQALIG